VLALTEAISIARLAGTRIVRTRTQESRRREATLRQRHNLPAASTPVRGKPFAANTKPGARTSLAPRSGSVAGDPLARQPCRSSGPDRRDRPPPPATPASPSARASWPRGRERRNARHGGGAAAHEGAALRPGPSAPLAAQLRSGRRNNRRPALEICGTPDRSGGSEARVPGFVTKLDRRTDAATDGPIARRVSQVAICGPLRGSRPGPALRSLGACRKSSSSLARPALDNAE